MARRIITARLREKSKKSDRDEDEARYGRLAVDDLLDFYWRQDSSGKITCDLSRLGTTDEFLLDGIIGTVASDEDVKWLSDALQALTLENVWSRTLRVHELGIWNKERLEKQFKVEVLTGQDHDMLAVGQRQREWLGGAIGKWWILVFLIFILYWLVL